MTKIYTKTGDKGETSLLGKRVKKDSLEIEMLGTLDELNAALGVLNSYVREEKRFKDQVFIIQNNLFVLGAGLASLGIQSENIPQLSMEEIEEMEGWIDEMEKELFPLKNFILPGGDSTASHGFLVRAICRRAERNLISVSEKYQDINPLFLIYLNRLSDYLFVLSRFLNQKKGGEEIVWNSR